DRPTTGLHAERDVRTSRVRAAERSRETLRSLGRVSGAPSNVSGTARVSGSAGRVADGVAELAGGAHRAATREAVEVTVERVRRRDRVPVRVDPRVRRGAGGRPVALGRDRRA